jgi:hypothetical protein
MVTTWLQLSYSNTTSAAPPPPFTCASAKPELHRQPPPCWVRSWQSWIRRQRHGLRRCWREEGGGGGRLPRPHNLLGRHPHAASSIPDHARHRWHHRCQDPSPDSRRGVGGVASKAVTRTSSSRRPPDAPPVLDPAIRLAAPDRYHQCQIRVWQPCNSPLRGGGGAQREEVLTYLPSTSATMAPARSRRRPPGAAAARARHQRAGSGSLHRQIQPLCAGHRWTDMNAVGRQLKSRALRAGERSPAATFLVGLSGCAEGLALAAALRGEGGGAAEGGEASSIDCFTK